MSRNNVESKIIITSKGEKIPGKRIQNKSPFKKDKLTAGLSMNYNDLNITLPNREMNFLESSTNNFIYDIKEEKDKKVPSLSRKAYLSKLNNSINNFDFSENSYMIPINNRDLSMLTDTNIFDSNSNNTNTTTSNNSNKNKVLKNMSIKNIKTKN